MLSLLATRQGELKSDNHLQSSRILESVDKIIKEGDCESTSWEPT